MKKIGWVILVLSLITAGCKSSKITSSWKAEDAEVRKYNKILVLGLTRESDRSIQENMENHLAADLKEFGYNAVSSLQEYGPKVFDKMDEEAAIEKLTDSGVDAVITIVLLDKKKERRYVPGTMYYSPYGYYYNRFWGYRLVLSRRIYETGYYVTDTRYFWESNLYDMKTQKLIYSVQTRSFEPANQESMAHDYGTLIVKNMVREKVLQNQGNSSSKAF
jgi:hypothetical protein